MEGNAPSRPLSRRLLIVAIILFVIVAAILALPLFTGESIGYSLRKLGDWWAVAKVRVPPFSSETLEQLRREDQADRTPPIERKATLIRDAQRRKICLAWLEAGEIAAPRDRYNAALIFHHGKGPEDYQRAYQLAKAAAEGGLDEARWLKAAAEDRYLLEIGLPQRYGTQYERDASGRVTLLPVDPGTTDEQRAEWNVVPLKEYRQRATESK